MKIGIICFWDRWATPYLTKYEKVLDDLEIDYDVILWERTNLKKKPISDNIHEKILCIPEKKGFFGKLISFLQWKDAISKVIKRERFDNLIVLTTHPAVMLNRLLRCNFPDKFIFDIRDYTMERIVPYRKLVMKLIDSSAFTTISSKGFMRWLDEHQKIIPNHNITIDTVVENKVFDFNKTPIQFTFAGNVRLDKQTVALMLTLANNKRYHMRFVGRVLPGCQIFEIVKEYNIKNIAIEGPFSTIEKRKIYSNTDLINAIYANASDNLSFGDSTPIPNRLYDAIIFRCPLIASKGTYLSKIVEEYHLGLSINGFDQDAEIQINNYLESFDQSEFISGCKALLNEIVIEEDAFLDKLRATLSSWR